MADRFGQVTDRPRSVYALVAIPVFLWGTSFALSKIALQSISPLGLVAVRAALAVAVVSLALALRKPGGPRGAAPRDPARILLLGFLGVPLQVGLQAYALTMTSAHHGGWIIAVSPITTAVLAALLLGERFPRLKAAGVVLGFAGTLLVMSNGGRPALGLPGTRGDLLVLASAVNWSVYTLIGRQMMTRRPPLPLTARILFCGAALAAAVYIVAGAPRELPSVPLRTWLVLGYLGIGCSGVGYLCWSLALEKLEAGRVTSFQNIQPLIAAVTAAWWLGEPIGAAAVAGGLLVICGVYLVQRGARS